MRVPVRVICRRGTGLGVALAGVAPIEVDDAPAAAAALTSLAPTPGRGGVVLVERDLYEALPAATLRLIRKEGTPILMPFPGPAPLRPGVTPEEELLEVLRRAVGYRMRLR